MGGGKGDTVFSGDSAAGWEDGKVPETDGGDGCTAVCMHLTPLNCALENN